MNDKHTVGEKMARNGGKMGISYCYLFLLRLYLLQKRNKIFYSKVAVIFLFYIPILHNVLREERVLRGKAFQGAKGIKEQTVLRSKVFQGEIVVKEQIVLRRKVFQAAKGVEKHSVLRRKSVLRGKKC